MKKSIVFLCSVIASSTFLLAKDETAGLSLDSYLQIRGFNLNPEHSINNEGYATCTQLAQMSTRLDSYTNIKRVVEIGLNAGHSADNFFRSCKTLEMFVSLDLNAHPYTKYASEYLQAKYGTRFIFIPGDSHRTVFEIASKESSKKFDLIYIDGDHSYMGCRSDIENCKVLAHSGSYLWIDDYDNKEVKKAIRHAEKHKLIHTIIVHRSDEGGRKRSWAEAHYRV